MKPWTPSEIVEPSGHLPEAMDTEAPLTVEAPNTAGKLYLSPTLRWGPAAAPSMEVEHSGLEAVIVGSESRVVTTAEVVAPESASMGLESEGLQAHRRDWGLFVTSEYAELSPIEEGSKEAVNAYFNGSVALARSDLVVQLSHNSHGDLFVNAQEALLQAFALTHAVAAFVGRREVFMMDGVESL
ncbi:hypothetical protein GUJ93_ZPchr0006g40862 [Zizania palustris]|uniref:Uncharacterized protein n=1 Tax=Zizania palustris TaxID=103762 RepID=A0A8J5T780_ZIZPA|nr:hypothetical protein GUJ93_ZPchr0006g40862 [Zizania palustris]